MAYNHPATGQGLNWQLNNLHTSMDRNAIGEPVIRTVGGSLDYSISISSGNLEGVSYIEKFGMNVDVDANKETVWDAGGIYEYLTDTETIAITSTLPLADNATGTGAQTVEVQGLDTDFNLLTETLTVGGASSTGEFLRVFRARVITAGSNEVNEGVLSIISDTSTTTLAQIGVDGSGSNAAGRGQTFMSQYTVPAGKTAYLTQWTVGAGKQNTDAIAFLMCRNILEDGWSSKDVIAVSATTYSKDYTIPMMFTEKTDIEVRAFSSANNSLVSSTFCLILIDN